MVAPANPVQLVRLSPSGCELGTPPQLIGGGALIPGRVWLAQGTGAVLTNVPSSGGPFGYIPGLDAVPVDMRVGYTYDIEADSIVFGTSGNTSITVLGSQNGGLSYVAVGGFGGQETELRPGSKRWHVTNVAGKFDHIAVSISTTDAASGACQYLPSLSALKVREYSQG